MSVTIELSDEVLARLEAVAAARGVSVEEFAAQTLAQVPVVDATFASLVTDTIAGHREILDRLAAT
jgi:predicted transcriptional regulator